MTTYTLTEQETERYDSGDQRVSDELMRELHSRFGDGTPGRNRVKTEVEHPDGYIVAVMYRDETETETGARLDCE